MRNAPSAGRLCRLKTSQLYAENRRLLQENGRLREELARLRP